MDHGHSMDPRCSMHMLFTWDTTDLCVVFKWWHVRGPVSLILTLLGVVALGMSYELLRMIARKYDESTLEKIHLLSPALEPVDGRRSPAITPERGGLPVEWLPVVEVFFLNVAKDSVKRRQHVIKSLLYGFQVFYSYFLMLVAMTYQGYVLIAIGIGAALGYYFFHDDKSPSARAMACH